MSDAPLPPGIAGGQVQRVAGASRDAALHDQMYRYAQDFQLLQEDKNALEHRYDMLVESYQQLREARTMLANLLHSSHDMHLTTSPSGVILQCNAATRLLGPVGDLIDRPLCTLVPPSHLAAFDSLLAAVLQADGSDPDERELHLRRPGPEAGTLIMVAKVLPIRKDGRIESIHWLMRDMTPVREAEFESQISSTLFRSASEGIMITDLTGDILAVNPAFTQITGYSAAEVIGRNPGLLKSGVQDAHFYQQFWAALREQGQWQGELFNRRKNGEVYPEWLTVNAARDSDGRILSYIGVFSDMSRLQEAEKRLSYIALHDILTGLPNRLLLLDRLRKAIAQARRGGFPLTVLFIDLDRFKPINDTLGHEVGDSVLQEVAQRLQQVVRDADTLGRLGGDEFVIVASGLAAGPDVERFADKLVSSLAQPIPIPGGEASIGCSIGIAHLQDGMTTEQLLHDADIAMYRAKRDGGGTHRSHDPENASVDPSHAFRLKGESRP